MCTVFTMPADPIILHTALQLPGQNFRSLQYHKNSENTLPAKFLAASLDNTTKTEQSSFKSFGWMRSANKDLQEWYMFSSISKQVTTLLQIPETIQLIPV